MGTETGRSADELTARTLGAVEAAAARVGLSASGATLLRLGSNAVFDLGDVVARVTLPGASTEPALESVQRSRWLNASGVPAVVALDVPQPVEVEGVSVTFWVSMGTEPRYGSTEHLAVLLRRLHALPNPADLELPAFAPFDRLENRLDHLTLPVDDVDFLRARAERLSEEFAGLSFEGEPVVLHGDANVGNVLLDRQGVARFIDLDGMCRGPREWDLVLTGMFADRYGWHTEAEYRAFARTYGTEVRACPGYETLADIRELLMVSWISAKAAESLEHRSEALKRVTALKGPGSRHDWIPI